MKCADPVLCYTSEKKRQFRHYSLASLTFKQMAQQVYNCGKCLTCRKKKSYELACRCLLHSSLYRQNSFLTLTYDELRPGYQNTRDYTHIQKFTKRLRSYCFRKFAKRIEIFNVHEYGKNGKKHWHLIVFNHDFTRDILKNKKLDSREIHSRKNGRPLYKSLKLQELWPYGFASIGSVEEASAMYQAQYMEKDFKNNHAGTLKKSSSKHSGLGKPYFLKHYRQILMNGFVSVNKSRLPVPRYFEKLAHKHYSHFYDKTNFFDLPYRKKLYTPFKHGEENLNIANLYQNYIKLKSEKIKTLDEEWTDFINSLTFDTKPDFILSNENQLYDLKNKVTKENF